MPRRAQSTPATETAFHCELTVPKEYIQKFANISEGDTLSEKVQFVAQGALLDMCEGGLMLNAKVVEKLTEALGEPPDPDQIVEHFSTGVGRRDGKLEIIITLDPEYEQVVAAAAEFQGVTTREILQNAWQTAWDNGDFYDPRTYCERVMMNHADREALIKLLGKNFTSGTELAGLIREYCTREAGIFSELDRG